MTYLKKNLFIIIFFIIPFIIIWSSPNDYEWLGRIFSLVIVFVAVMFFLFRYALSKKSKFILEGGKLNRSEFKKQKKIFEYAIRLLAALFCFSFIVVFIIPFSIDVGSLITKSNSSILRLEGKVNSNNTTFGLWFLSQRLNITNIVSNKKQYYTLLYSLKPRLIVGHDYEFVILKRSKFILDVINK